jgi:hypothetical protein
MVDLRLGVAAAHVATGGDSDSMCCAWKSVDQFDFCLVL